MLETKWWQDPEPALVCKDTSQQVLDGFLRLITKQALVGMGHVLFCQMIRSPKTVPCSQSQENFALEWWSSFPDSAPRLKVDRSMKEGPVHWCCYEDAWSFKPPTMRVFVWRERMKHTQMVCTWGPLVILAACPQLCQSMVEDQICEAFNQILAIPSKSMGIVLLSKAGSCWHCLQTGCSHLIGITQLFCRLVWSPEAYPNLLRISIVRFISSSVGLMKSATSSAYSEICRLGFRRDSSCSSSISRYFMCRTLGSSNIL